VKALLQRNVLLLLGAQLVFVAGSSMTVTMGGIVGSRLAPSPSLATLPVSLMVLGTALGTVPASLLMQRLGRRLGFAFAAALAAVAVQVAALALRSENFALYCLSTAMTGATLAFSQQFRFAAAESVPPERAGQAISFILLGSIGGAFVGPELVASGDRIVEGNAFLGAVQGASVLFLFAVALLLAMRRTEATEGGATAGEARPLREILQAPLFRLAVAAGVVGQGVMVFIMTATPVSMHVMDGHDLATTAGVIRAHVLAMYIPSLVSGLLIARFGERTLMLWGVAALLATLAFGLSGHAVMHYTSALVLLGVGWNFLFVGGTTLLVKSYQPSERYRAQALNEAAVFGTSATGSLLAGTLLMSLGWMPLLLSTLPVLLLMGFATFRLRKAPLPTFT